MNTGAEAVESGIKVARKWGYEVKGVPEGRARIIVAADDFHGRTTTIVGFSTDPDARGGFGPFTPGFDVVPYGDLAALRGRGHARHRRRAARADPGRGGRDRAARRLPGRGPGDLRRPPRAVRRRRDPVGARPHRAPARDAAPRASTPTSTCSARRSAAASCRCRPSSPTRDVLGVLRPGQHGSTFGGNPLACAVGRAVIGLLEDGDLLARARDLGAHLHGRLAGLVGHGVSRGARRRALGGRGRGPAPGRPAGPSARRSPRAACWSRTPTARRSGSRRRSWSPTRSSTSPSTRWATCSR